MAGAAALLPADAIVARSDAEAVRQALSRHGFAILRDALSHAETAALARCDALALACFAAGPHKQIAMRCAGSVARRQTRQLAACSELPLTGIGLHTVSEDGERIREQIHLVTDPAAMRLMRWPARSGRLGGLGDAVRRAMHVLHNLCTELLATIEPAAEGARRTQAELSGDPSVLDLFLYPNEHKRPANMRTHTDPGLLTVTRVSDTPGLQVLDAESGAWLDVEAMAGTGDLVLLCSESLQEMSRGAYPAAPHRVRCAPAPRLSVVFELRCHHAPPLPRPPAPPMLPLNSAPPSRTAASAPTHGSRMGLARAGAADMAGRGASARATKRRRACNGATDGQARRAPAMENPCVIPSGCGGRRRSGRGGAAVRAESPASAGDEDGAARGQPHPAESVCAGLDYVRAFVDARLARGSTAEEVMAEFGIRASELPTCGGGQGGEAAGEGSGGGGAAALTAGALAEVVLRWVVSCRARSEAHAAFESAEYVTIAPAFADCTGRYVEVSWSESFSV
jgi:hypothetical protein